MNTRSLILQYALSLIMMVTGTFALDTFADTPLIEASITAPAMDGMTVAPGGSVTFTGSGTDSGGNELTYTWMFSDGTTQTGPSVNYLVASNASPGTTITGTLVLTDSTGAEAVTQPTRTVTVASAPAVTVPDSKLIFISNFFGNSATIIDTTANNVAATLTVKSNFLGEALSKDGKFAYLIYPTAGGPHAVVSAINPDTHSITAKADVGSGPYAVAYTPDGKFAYATVFDSNGTVTVTDLSTQTVTATIRVGRYPTGIAITPDSTTAYVANYLDGTVSVINIAANTVSKTIKVGAAPFRVGNLLPTPATTFSAFDVQNLQVAPALGMFSLSATFTLADASVGIAPSVQTTVLNIGDYCTLVIPPGAFKLDWWGNNRFSGVFRDVAVQGVLRPIGNKQYALEVYTRYANVIFIPNPVTVKLTFGGIQTSSGGQTVVGENGTTTVVPVFLR